MRIILLTLIALAASAQALPDLARGLAHPPDDARIMMRWWWFGPSLTHAGIDRDLLKMKEGGIGGAEIQPVYPVRLEGNYPYLSPQFFDTLRYASDRAAALGLRLDVTIGSGWPFGGPHIPVTQAAGRLRIEKVATKTPYLADGEKLLATIDGVAYISSRTGMQVKRPAIGAEGFVLDHYDRAAIDNHLNAVATPILKALGRPPYAIFSDSLEVFASDWTPNFLAEFQKRRGYDLTPYLPALNEDRPDSPAVRNDWAKTLAELCVENYLQPVTAWAHQHHTLFRSQTYGTPPVTLAAQQFVDLPEGEKPHWRAFTAARWATSAAHLYKKPVVSTETWTWLHSPAYRATPLDMKAEADLHFLQGVNQLIGHGWPSPPGTALYAAAVFSDSSPWFIAMPDIAAYLQRVSWLLRQGSPANDVALYIPTADIRARMRPGAVSIDRDLEHSFPVIADILEAGYNFDLIDDETIEKLGIPYPILVLPDVERMPAATARKIASFSGKTIALGRIPDKAPGLRDEVPHLDLAVAPDLTAALRAALPPDLRAPAGIGFVHRKTPQADIYFVANTTNASIDANLQFRAPGNPTPIDPLTLKTPPKVFAPYESRIYIVSSAPAPPLPPATSGIASLLTVSGGPWPKDFSGVRTYETKFTKTTGRRFVLNFGEGIPVEGPQRSPNGMRAWMESPVREAAVVSVNGKRAGYVWRPPYELDITDFVQNGENIVRIEVANTRINQLAAEPRPNYKLLNLRYGTRFEPQDMENLRPLPSGLQQPLKLITEN